MWDDWYGHRHPLTGLPQGDKDEWVEWDHALAQAYQTIEYYRDQNGIFQWQKDDPLEDIAATRKYDQFQAAIDGMTRGTAGKPYKPSPGEFFVPDVKIRSGANREMWTYQEWLDAKQKEMLEEALAEHDKMDGDPPPIDA